MRTARGWACALIVAASLAFIGVMALLTAPEAGAVAVPEQVERVIPCRIRCVPPPTCACSTTTTTTLPDVTTTSTTSPQSPTTTVIDRDPTDGVDIFIDARPGTDDDDDVDQVTVVRPQARARAPLAVQASPTFTG